MRSDPRTGRAFPYVAAILLAAGAFWLALLPLPPSLKPPSLAILATAWLVFIAHAVVRAMARLRRETAEAERNAARASRLAQLTMALSQARTHQAAIEAALQEPLHALGADAGMLFLVEPDATTMHIVRSVGYTAAEHERRTKGAAGRPTPARIAAGRGAPVLFETPAAQAAEFGDGAATGAPLTFGAVAAVPLLIGSRAIAAVQLEFRAPRRFNEDEKEYLELLGPRAAQALDRTGQFEAALRERAEAETLRARADEELVHRQEMETALRASEARYRLLAARTGRLHGLAAALSEAVTPDAVARAVIAHGRNVLGASAGEVLLVDEDAFQTICADVPGAGDRPVRYPAEPGFCATEALRRREPVLVASFEEWQERYPRSASLLADGGYISSATLPIFDDGAVAGVLAFHFTAPVNFDDEYRTLLLSVAQHCGQALGRAHAYEAEQRARADAESANRLKDKFVSVVSHELRTPLHAILGWTSMLRQADIDPPKLERGLQAIADNATRQARLVDDLLEFSRLQAGRLQLDFERADLRALLRGAIEAIIPVAAGSGVQLRVDPIPSLVVMADPRRIEQVFLNLLGNAVKFTPEGGMVRVGAIATEDRIEVRVADTGSGIDPAFLPHLFDPFRQASPSGSRHGGVGLGLSIARELVEGHGGEIHAFSDGPGRGATFTVVLPAVAAATATVH